ncbi:MAG TPA: penicillin-binding protein 1B [Arenimonas sp.]|nr:penicillin-binding protein 1B [Arenimonas sp.]
MARKASSRHQPTTAAPARPWRRWLLRIGLLGFGLLLGVGAPMAWYLDREVQTQFNALSWQVPTRVYARPLRLAEGVRLTADALERELQMGAYRADGGEQPGTYAREGTRFRIATRGFVDLDGAVPALRIEVQLGAGVVRRVVEQGSGRRLDSARIEPVRIATLYGNSSEERRLVRLQDVPPLLITGLQAVEDRNFKHHHGVDPLGVMRAIWVNLREGELEQGASTLTQQLVRSLFLTREKRWQRKLKEAAYSLAIEARFDKARILETYLNQVFMGQHGNQAVHGVAAGAEFWFGRDLASLRTGELALLVGLVQGPSLHDPRRHPEKAKARRNLVLSVWADLGLIAPEIAQRAKDSPLGVSARPLLSRNRYPAFMDLVQRQLARDYPADALRGAGLSVHTTLSPYAQSQAEQSVKSTLEALQGKKTPPLQAGLVLTDSHSGDVLAMVGNRRSDEPGFNRALEAQRPVGSLLKPLVYLLALAQPDRWSLATPVDDTEITVVLPNGKRWQPGNYDGQSHGRVAMVDALAMSYNQATVRVGMEVGPERLADLLAVLAGLRAAPNPSLILGSVDLSPFAMAQVYQFLASGGRLQPLRAVRGVLATDGKALNRYDQRIEPAQPGDALAARLVTLALQEAVRSGTGRALMAQGFGPLQVAGKTGTSNDDRDSWFAGYSGDHLGVIWVGNDQNQKTGLTGASGALRVWSTLFSKLPTGPLHGGDEGIEWGWVDAEQYATTEDSCPGARRYPFVAGFLPPDHVSCIERRWFDWFRNRDRSTLIEEQP